jgi:hypothetical protein
MAVEPIFATSATSRQVDAAPSPAARARGDDDFAVMVGSQRPVVAISCSG